MSASTRRLMTRAVAVVVTVWIGGSVLPSCHSPISGHREITLNLEVGCAYFSADTTLWALKRVDASLVENVPVHGDGVAEVACGTGGCDVVRVVPGGQEATPGRWQLKCRVLGYASDDSVITPESRILLVLEPFPVQVARSVATAVARQPSTTQHVVVTYGVAESGRLAYKGFGITGRTAGAPIMWK